MTYSETNLEDLFQDFKPADPHPEDRIPATMTESEIAAFLGLATSQVRTKTRDGTLVKNGRGRWDVRASLHGYIARLRDGAIKGGGQVPDDLKTEKLRLAKHQADKIEIQNAAARGELVRSADVEREWANVLRDVRSTVLAVPSRVGSKLAHLTAHDVAEIDREIKAALEGLANGN
ncbi:Phage DNA packaging protein Nu1 [Aquimixticola soesokkakensis]|uniref:Phage DNA packaging protein Nu1 n=1 Tax=Aquimixticola soesokkakensis TaxID=1519096 RepID=A0A1Y5SE97_9RHOB|nr:hypothetical protein [Aquimixticola soesokkakensis]SLN35706.1 Phage DNA packaging protein Nu1 [Aquimixticola soesokkakensis]